MENKNTNNNSSNSLVFGRWPQTIILGDKPTKLYYFIRSSQAKTPAVGLSEPVAFDRIMLVWGNPGLLNISVENVCARRFLLAEG